MTLLPREQHALNEIARRFRHDDPTFVHWLSGRVGLRHPRIAVGLVYLIAPALIVTGAVFGVLGIAVTGIVLAVLTPLAGWRLMRPRLAAPPDDAVPDDL
jgi:hypothetical protein